MGDKSNSGLSSTCVICKLRKLKCDGKNPCGRCVKRNMEAQCSYSVDRRKDKKYYNNGSKSFIFKNSIYDPKCKPKEYSYNKVISELDSNSFMSKASQNVNKSDSYILETNDEDLSGLINSKSWNNEASFFDDNDFRINLLSIDEFMKLLGDNPQAYELANNKTKDDSQNDSMMYDISYINPDTMIETEPLEHIILIDVLYEDITHTPPGIQKEHLLDLEYKSDNKESIKIMEDEQFLLFTALTLGALTLRKRELLHPEYSQKKYISEDGLPLAAVEAFKYYKKARDLLPNILQNSTLNGFCGLALMANFMTMMISLEDQLGLCFKALIVAVNIGFNREDFYENALRDGNNGLGLILLFWNVWCSSCMLCSFHGRSAFMKLDEIKIPRPSDLPGIGNHSPSMSFIQLRIRLASLQANIIDQIYISEYPNLSNYKYLERELEDVNGELQNLMDRPINDAKMNYRNELLTVELSCLTAQTFCLLLRPSLVNRVSLRAVNIAKSIIFKLWGYYTPDFSYNPKRILENLDWNFCYPLRSTLLTLWIASVILLKYKQDTEYLKDKEIFELNLAIKVLNNLVQILPIEGKLVSFISLSLDGKNMHQDKLVSSARFWASILD